MKKILLILFLAGGLQGKQFYILNQSSMTIKELWAIENDIHLLNKSRSVNYEVVENTITIKVMITAHNDAEKLSVVKKAIKEGKGEKTNAEKYEKEKISKEAGFGTVEAIGIIALISGLVVAYLKTGNIWFLVGAVLIVIGGIVFWIIRRQK